MVNALYISDNRGETLELKLTDPYSTGIYVQNIEGLGYPQTNIQSTRLVNYDIALYNYQEVNERNIVLTLGLIGNPSVEGSRHLLYDYLPIRYPIALEIATDERVGLIHGYVETITPDIFNNQEVIQVSILCLDPYFYTGGSKRTFLNTSEKPNFQFNKWFTDGTKPVGIISDDLQLEINSRFQNPRGFQLVIHAKNGSFDTVTIEYENGSIILNERRLTPYEIEDKNFFRQYDDIIIKNDVEDVSISLYRDGKYYNLMEPITDEDENVLYAGGTINKDFPQLITGRNIFNVVSKGLLYIYSNTMPRLSGVITDDELNSWNNIDIPGYSRLGVIVDIPYNWSEVHLDFHWENENYTGITGRWIVGNAKADGTVNTLTDPETGYNYKWSKDHYRYLVYSDNWTIGDDKEFGSDVPKPNERNVFEVAGPRAGYKSIIAFYLAVESRIYGIPGHMLEPNVEIFVDETPYEWGMKNTHQGGTKPSNPWVYVTCLETELSTSEKPMLEGYEYTSTNMNVDISVQYDDLYEAM